MFDNITSKLVAIFVVVVIVCSAAIPIISEVNREATVTTTTETYGENSLTAYDNIVATSVRGYVNPNEAYYVMRGDVEFDGTDVSFGGNDEGDWLALSTYYLINNLNNFYISSTASYYAPDDNGAYQQFTSPSVSGVDSNIGLVLAPLSDGTYLLGATGDLYIEIYIPYTYINSNAAANYNPSGLETIIDYAFQSDSGGNYLRVNYPMTASNGFIYHITGGADVYYNDGGVYKRTSNTSSDEQVVANGVLIQPIVDGISSVGLRDYSTDESMLIPYEYSGDSTSGTNEVSSYTEAITPVRGTVSSSEGTLTFTSDDAGDYVRYYTQNLETSTYHIGSTQTFYVDDGTTLAAYKVGDTVTGASLEFVVTEDNNKVYSVTGSTEDGYTVILPYEATYDVTTTEYSEKSPLIAVIPLLIIVGVVLAVVKWMIGRND